MNESLNKSLGEVLKQRRLMLSMTLFELSSKSHVSSSHLGRIERGERCPSARILKRLAEPLQMDEAELMSLAGYLSHDHLNLPVNGEAQLDPYVGMILSRETVEVQRVVVSILLILKGLTARFSTGSERG